jgi:hypothetical protein
MIALLVALALSNMPPPPPDTCKDTGVGTACRTPRRSAGICVQTQCPKTEFSPQGSKTVMVDCLVCKNPGPDGGAP